MIFTTYGFAFFTRVFFPLYRAARPARLRFGLLLAACPVAHARFAGLRRARWALISAMILSVLALVFYHSTPFFPKELVAAQHPARRHPQNRPRLPRLPRRVRPPPAARLGGHPAVRFQRLTPFFLSAA